MSKLPKVFLSIGIGVLIIITTLGAGRCVIFLLNGETEISSITYLLAFLLGLLCWAVLALFTLLCRVIYKFIE